MVGVEASPKHTTATAGSSAVQAAVALVTETPMVWATGPVSGAERTRSLVDSTCLARAADTGVVRTLSAIVAPGVIDCFRNVIDASASWSGASTCG